MSGYTLSCDYLVANESAVIGKDVILNKTGLSIKDGVTISADSVKFPNGIGMTKDGFVTPQGPINLSGDSLGFPDGFSLRKDSIVDKTGATQILESGHIKLTSSPTTTTTYAGDEIRFNNDAGLGFIARADSIAIPNGCRLVKTKLDFPNGTAYSDLEMAFVGGIRINPARIQFGDGSTFVSDKLTPVGAFNISSATFSPININSTTLGPGTSSTSFIGVVSDVVRATPVFNNVLTQAALFRTQVTDTVTINPNSPVVGAEIGVTLQGTTGNITAPIYALRSSLNAPSFGSRQMNANIMTHLYIDSNNNNGPSLESYSAIAIHEGGVRKLDCIMDIEVTSGTVVNRPVNTSTIAGKSLRMKIGGVVHYLPLYLQTL